MLKDKNLVFVFPYRGTGGVSLLFLRLAEYIGQNFKDDFKGIYLVDFEDGFMAKNKKDPSIQLIPYSDDQIEIPEQAIMIYQSMTPWTIFKNFNYKQDTRILFWNCHPFNLVPTFPGLRELMGKSRKFSRFAFSTFLFTFKNTCVNFLRLLENKSAIVFVDGPNVTNTEAYLGLRIHNPFYLPIFLGQDQFVGNEVSRAKDELHFGWVGRVVDFKFFILKHTLERLEKLSAKSGQKIKFTVVGTGDYIGQLKDAVKTFNHLEIEFIDHIGPSELTGFIKELDILFAMGTSALEGGAAKVPTVLLDFTYGELEQDYIFKFLYESQNFSVADYIGSEHYQNNNTSLDTIVDEVLRRKEVHGQKCYEYVSKNHSIDVIYKKFVLAVMNTQLTYSNLQEANLLRVPLVYRIFKKVRALIKG
ncbi:hypothetical protein M899_1425 [Bacteriovorax sp. BSW11_IV]|uniref:hypothetical protein n=1 Tax=Bacteriovorax sp. BSW11_IV TaxID=1353529 RepID=UPI00038A2EA4|nr:hypothetical protein [Bacteriovorax sp. BSW11_IV]EQC45830.1 hypothetical protein M899_1425 [Bacteriovorax sp. BSW11_IV]